VPALAASADGGSGVISLFVDDPAGAYFVHVVPKDLTGARFNSWNWPAGAVGGLSVTAVGSSPAAAGASVSGNALTLQPADGSHPGVVSLSTQTLGAGVKTLAGVVSATGVGINGAAESVQGVSNAGGSTVVRGTNIYLQGQGGAAATSVTANGPVVVPRLDMGTLGSAQAIGSSGSDLTIGAPTGGDILLRDGNTAAHWALINAAGVEVDVVGQSFILKSADGTRWKLVVADTTGVLSTTLA
jgi:hypothetical protein